MKIMGNYGLLVIFLSILSCVSTAPMDSRLRNRNLRNLKAELKYTFETRLKKGDDPLHIARDFRRKLTYHTDRAKTYKEILETNQHRPKEEQKDWASRAEESQIEADAIGAVLAYYGAPNNAADPG